MASTYQTVRYGSTGSAVRQLQSALNRKGYQLSEDGIFGAKTRAAVRDYQKKNELLLDGIAGSQTWNHLMSAAAAPSGPTESRQVLSGVSDETAARLAQLEKGYEASGDVTAAQEEQRSIEALRPGAWRSSYAGQLEQLYSEISGRGAFRYDPAEDAAFVQYAGMYQRQGRRAMEDTLGQAAALTGGYGSSYAQATGQQSYGEYLQKLNEVLPELEQAARSRYDAEGKSMLQQYQLLQGREDDERSAWEAAMEAWQKEADSAAKRTQTAAQQDYDAWQDALKYYRDKANAEQKAADGKTYNTGAAAPAQRTESLSSAAAESLERAMGNYFRAGDSASAQSLLAQYSGRMTPAQKKRFAALFSRYDAEAGI